MLYFEVTLCVCTERGHVVDLKHPRFQFVVKHYIET